MVAQNRTVTLDGAQLKAICDKNETSLAVMMSLAERRRFRPITDISHMKNLLIQKGEKIVTDDYMQMWKDLQTHGVGSVIYGRKGKPHRFKWNYSLKEVGNSALSGRDLEAKVLRALHGNTKAQAKEVKEAPKKPRGTPVKIKPTLSLVPKAADFEVPIPETQETQSIQTQVVTQNVLYIPLRADFTFDVKMPQLSKQEADMICAAIQRCV